MVTLYEDRDGANRQQQSRPPGNNLLQARRACGWNCYGAKEMLNKSNGNAAVDFPATTYVRRETGQLSTSD